MPLKTAKKTRTKKTTRRRKTVAVPVEARVKKTGRGKYRISLKSKRFKLSPSGLMVLPFKIPTSYSEIEALFGKFEWHDLENSVGANIVVDPLWAAQHIVKVEVPGVLPKPVYMHQLIAPYFQSAIAEAARRVPGYQIVSCASYVPRHKRHDITAGLSLHSWGIAVDINPASNPYGAAIYSPALALKDKLQRRYDMPPEFVQVLKEVGFVWGEDWKSGKDPMHFQAARGV